MGSGPGGNGRPRAAALVDLPKHSQSLRQDGLKEAPTAFHGCLTETAQPCIPERTAAPLPAAATCSALSPSAVREPTDDQCSDQRPRGDGSVVATRRALELLPGGIYWSLRIHIFHLSCTPPYPTNPYPSGTASTRMSPRGASPDGDISSDASAGLAGSVRGCYLRKSYRTSRQVLVQNNYGCGHVEQRFPDC